MSRLLALSLVCFLLLLGSALAMTCIPPAEGNWTIGILDVVICNDSTHLINGSIIIEGRLILSNTNFTLNGTNNTINVSGTLELFNESYILNTPTLTYDNLTVHGDLTVVNSRIQSMYIYLLNGSLFNNSYGYGNIMYVNHSNTTIINSGFTGHIYLMNETFTNSNNSFSGTIIESSQSTMLENSSFGYLYDSYYGISLEYTFSDNFIANNSNITLKYPKLYFEINESNVTLDNGNFSIIEDIRFISYNLSTPNGNNISLWDSNGTYRYTVYLNSTYENRTNITTVHYTTSFNYTLYSGFAKAYGNFNLSSINTTITNIRTNTTHPIIFNLTMIHNPNGPPVISIYNISDYYVKSTDTVIINISFYNETNESIESVYLNETLFSYDNISQKWFLQTTFAYNTTISINATDRDGNGNITIIGTIIVDDIAPSFSNFDINGGTIQSGITINATNLNISFNISENNLTVLNMTFGRFNFTKTVDYSWNFTILPGRYILNAIMMDYAGNVNNLTYTNIFINSTLDGTNITQSFTGDATLVDIYVNGVDGGADQYINLYSNMTIVGTLNENMTINFTFAGEDASWDNFFLNATIDSPTLLQRITDSNLTHLYNVFVDVGDSFLADDDYLNATLLFNNSLNYTNILYFSSLDNFTVLSECGTIPCYVQNENDTIIFVEHFSGFAFVNDTTSPNVAWHNDSTTPQYNDSFFTLKFNVTESNPASAFCNLTHNQTTIVTYLTTSNFSYYGSGVYGFSGLIQNLTSGDVVFNLSCEDYNGNSGYSEQTIEIIDTTKPIFTSNPSTSGRTQTSATTSFTVSEYANFTLFWSANASTLGNAMAQPAYDKTQEIAWSGLYPETRYYFAFNITDRTGNILNSTVYSFITLDADDDGGNPGSGGTPGSNDETMTLTVSKEEACVGEVISATVKDENDDFFNDVTITGYPQSHDSDILVDEMTTGNGRAVFSFDVTGTMIIEAYKSGYDDESTSIDIINCSEDHCTIDSDCNDDEVCNLNECELLNCSCVSAVDHSCPLEYCCSDDDCLEGFCTNNECVVEINNTNSTFQSGSDVGDGSLGQEITNNINDFWSKTGTPLIILLLVIVIFAVGYYMYKEEALQKIKVIFKKKPKKEPETNESELKKPDNFQVNTTKPMPEVKTDKSEMTRIDRINHELQLKEFVLNAKSKGLTQKQLTDMFVNKGWTKDNAENAISRYWK